MYILIITLESCMSMHKTSPSRIIVVSLIVVFFEFSYFPLTESQPTNQISPLPQNVITGKILFSPMWSTTTYLIDNTGTVNHTWSSNYLPGVSVYWLGDGTILRTIRVGIGGGSGGGIQKVQWDGSVVWDYRYNTNGNLSHHDVKMLPNGNVLMIAWETKTYAEAVQAGRNPSHVPASGLMPDHVIEVKPTGPTSGEIVWAWHVWDHLIQDYDASKDNYGVVGDHPELIDVNYGSTFMTVSDWLHTNSIDYNPEFDQILLSVHNFNEIWVIDHSTTTTEAAGHTGGNSGHGGDILYRWGNPEAYRAGTTSDQIFYGQHDASWIKPGYPGEGDILVFNNGVDRPGGSYSSVDQITPPVDENGQYSHEPGSAYGPAEETWTYTANPPTSFYANQISSGAERLEDGDTLICDGTHGVFFEITYEGTTVWEYTNPYPTSTTNNVFKIVYVSPEELTGPNLDCSGTLSWTRIKPGATVTGSFQVRNIGGNGTLLNWTINTSSISWGTWSYTPQSGENLTPENGPLTVHVSVVAPDDARTHFEGYLRVENQQNPDDFNLIPVTLSTPADASSIPTMIHHGLFYFLQHHFMFVHEVLLRLFLKNS
jgi:hypothetical protein